MSCPSNLIFLNVDKQTATVVECNYGWVPSDANNLAIMNKGAAVAPADWQFMCSIFGTISREHFDVMNECLYEHTAGEVFKAAIDKGWFVKETQSFKEKTEGYVIVHSNDFAW